MSEFNTDEPEAAENTDTPLFSEVEDDYYSPSCRMTKGRALGIDVGGTVIVKPLREWFEAVNQLKECREGRKFLFTWEQLRLAEKLLEQRTKDDIKARIISSFAGHDIHSLDPVNVTIDEILEAVDSGGEKK